MSVRDPVWLERELRAMKRRIEMLERALMVRDGQFIGETEHGDKVYAVAPTRRAPKPKTDAT